MQLRIFVLFCANKISCLYVISSSILAIKGGNVFAFARKTEGKELLSCQVFLEKLALKHITVNEKFMWADQKRRSERRVFAAWCAQLCKGCSTQPFHSLGCNNFARNWAGQKKCKLANTELPPGYHNPFATMQRELKRSRCRESWITATKLFGYPDNHLDASATMSRRWWLLIVSAQKQHENKTAATQKPFTNKIKYMHDFITNVIYWHKSISFFFSVNSSRT